MNDLEKYQFDLNGYLLVPGLLGRDVAAGCLAAADALEHRVASTIDDEPHFIGHYGIRYHHDKEFGFSSYKNDWGGGRQYIVDDFLNCDAAFDPVVGHPATMAYVRELIMGPLLINSSELRYRHRGNITISHMGGPIDARNQYQFVGRRITDSLTGDRNSRDFNLLVVRVIYALHDVPIENGPLCVVPGSHKANYQSPYGQDPLQEPGMVGVPMRAGDALFFTENLRHGGLPNLLDTPRKTLHLAYGPAWAGSQSPAHSNGVVHVTDAAWLRYTEEQRAVLPLPTPAPTDFPAHEGAASNAALEAMRHLRNEIATLREQNRETETLKERNRQLEQEVQALRSRGFLGALFGNRK